MLLVRPRCRDGATERRAAERRCHSRGARRSPEAAAAAAAAIANSSRLLGRHCGGVALRRLALLAACAVSSDAHCLSVRRHENTGEVRFGDPKRDNFCKFASECFDLACPLMDSVAWPVDLDSFTRELPQNACGRVRRTECAAAFKRAELDCAVDDLSRAIWEARKRGFCVHCQQLVQGYKALLGRCPLRERWAETLRQVFVEFTAKNESELSNSDRFSNDRPSHRAVR